MAVDNIARGMAAKALENQGGGGSSFPIVNTAAVGQTIRVSAVDENGQPTEWEAVDFPSGGGGGGWELVSDTTLSEDVSRLEYTDLDCYDLRVAIFGRWNDADDSLANATANANILLNETGVGYQYQVGLIGYIRASSMFHTLIEATSANMLYPKVVVSTLPSGQAVALKSQTSTYESVAYGKSWKDGATEKLKKILIVPATSGVMLKAGARIIVMKRS